MASTAIMNKDTQIVVTSGPYAYREGYVIDPTVQGAGANQRKIKVWIDGVGEEYILPRCIEVPGVAKTATTELDDPMDPALDRFRPSETIVDQYISRYMPNGQSDVDFFLSLREDRDINGYSPNAAMVGPTQGGKSMLIQVLAVMAARRDGLPKPYPVFTMSGSSGVSSYDMFGQNTAVEVKGRETIVWMNGLIALAAKCGGILDLEEWNAMDTQQATALHSLLDDRRYFTNMQRAVTDGHGGWMPEKIQLNKNLWIICTINPGYRGTRTMNEATTNRFRWIPWDYDDAVETVLIPSMNVRSLGQAIRNLNEKNMIATPVGTSALIRLYRDAKLFGVPMALTMFTAMFTNPHDKERVLALVETNAIDSLMESEFSVAA